MKTNLMALWCFFLFVASISFAQTTAIPDANFEQELITQGIDSDGVVNGQALTQDLATVTILDVQNRNIADLTGIESFLALEELTITNNLGIASLDLSANLNLKVLTAINVGLSSNPNYGANTSYTDILLSRGTFTTADFSNFLDLEVLRIINFSNLTTLTLGNKPNLTVLDLGAAVNLTDIDVTGAPELVSVNLTATALSTIDLVSNTKLEVFLALRSGLIDVDFSNNKLLSDINVFDSGSLGYINLKNDDRQDLISLDMTSCPNLICIELDDLSFVQSGWTKDATASYSTGCFTIIPNAIFEQELISDNIDSDGIINGRAFTSDLESVTGANFSNQIPDFTGIEAFSSLRNLSIGGGSTTPSNIMLDLSSNTQLENLDLNIRELTSLILPNTSTLEILNIDRCRLSTLDLSQNTGMQRIDIRNTNISSINTTNMPNLERLVFQENDLVQINISQNPNLLILDLRQNELTSLDASANTALQSLNATSNSLQSITVKTGNGTNDIATLLVAANPDLECIEVDDENNIPVIWQKDATASYSVSCGPRPVFLNPPTEISSVFVTTIEFDRAVTGFEISDIIINGGTLSDFQSLSSTEYRVRITPTSVCASSVSIEVPANVAEDTQNKPNSASGVLTINTVDEDSPTVVLQDITIALDATGDASISGADIDNGSSDNCTAAADLNFSLNQFLFTCSDLGDNTVSVLVNDDEGNTQAGSVTVTVIDDIDPIVIAQDITVQLGANGQITITAANIDNGSSDNCSIDSLTLDKTEFSCANVGTNNVTLTVTDTSGNTNTAAAVVTVEEDPNQPLTAVAQDITVQLNASGQVTITPEDIDNGSGSGCGNITLSVDRTDFSCDDLGANTVTLTVTEGASSETATATVTVEDTLGPNLILQDITIDIESDGTSTISVADVNSGTNDNCSSEGDITLNIDRTTFDCTNLGENTVTVTAIDGLGNTSTGTSIVTVRDATAPTVLTQDITIALDANGNARISAEDIDNGSIDACSGIATVVLDISEFNCPQLGGNVVNLTVTDNDGNTATSSAMVTITAMDEDNNGIADDCESKAIVTSKGFSPNGDGINDTWVIENIDDFPNGKVSVFNRWGMKVFEAQNYSNDWDGVSTEGGGNKRLPAGAYLYVIETNDSEFPPKQGWIYINY